MQTTQGSDLVEFKLTDSFPNVAESSMFLILALLASPGARTTDSKNLIRLHSSTLVLMPSGVRQHVA